VKKRFGNYDRLTISLDKKDKDAIAAAAGRRGISDFIRAVVTGYIAWEKGAAQKKGKPVRRPSLSDEIRKRLEESPQ
jgi:hypothetical protein